MSECSVCYRLEPSEEEPDPVAAPTILQLEVTNIYFSLQMLFSLFSLIFTSFFLLLSSSPLQWSGKNWSLGYLVNPTELRTKVRFKKI